MRIFVMNAVALDQSIGSRIDVVLMPVVGEGLLIWCCDIHCKHVYVRIRGCDEPDFIAYPAHAFTRHACLLIMVEGKDLADYRPMLTRSDEDASTTR